MPEPLKSSIGEWSDDQYCIRGIPLARLMVEKDFVSSIWFTWTGASPSESERVILQACFVACIDHGEEPPSAQAARIVASCGKPVADAVAAGMLTLGPRHGNAASAASRWMREAVAAHRSATDVATAVLESRQRLPGIGHPEYDVDPRTTALHQLAKAQAIETSHFDFALEVSRLLSEQKGKPLPLNIDGALGALLADLKAPEELADAIFLCARTVGLVAHALEEAKSSVSYRRG